MLDRLYKSEKQLADIRETFEAVSSNSESLKDKKIIDLVKKNKALHIQAESLKNKAAKAAEMAIEFKEQSQIQRAAGGDSTLKEINMQSTMSMPVPEQEKRLKEIEKKMIKLRNENSEQKQLLDKATRLLEREIGEIVDINDLSKEESQWRGRQQKIELLKTQVKKLKSQMG